MLAMHTVNCLCYRLVTPPLYNNQLVRLTRSYFAREPRPGPRSLAHLLIKEIAVVEKSVNDAVEKTGDAGTRQSGASVARQAQELFQPAGHQTSTDKQASQLNFDNAIFKDSSAPDIFHKISMDLQNLSDDAKALGNAGSLHQAPNFRGDDKQVTIKAGEDTVRIQGQAKTTVSVKDGITTITIDNSQDNGNSGQSADSHGGHHGDRHDSQQDNGAGENHDDHHGHDHGQSDNQGEHHGGHQGGHHCHNGDGNGDSGSGSGGTSGDQAPSNGSPGNGAGSPSDDSSGGGDTSITPNTPATGGDTQTTPSTPGTGGDTQITPATPGSGGDTQIMPATPGTGGDTTSAKPTVPGDGTTLPTPNNPLVGAGAGDFSVGPNGFVGPNGQPWNFSGLNATVQDALQGYQNVFNDYPKMTAIRLNAVPSQDSAADIKKVVDEYTAKGIVVELEDHSGNLGADSTAWYKQMAETFKDNKLVMLETSNEPNADANTVAQSQIAQIQAIRSTGYSNPIGLQPVGGYDQSNIQTVLDAVGGPSQLFVTPHIYYSGSDPNGAMQYAQDEAAGAKGKGMFAVVDEFGSAMDGWHKDQQGDTVNASIIALNKQGTIGAAYWGMDNGNHPDGADSAFLNPDGSALTPEGQMIKDTWLG